MDTFVTYILFSEKHHKIYIGYTSNLIQRFYSHNFLSTKGYTFKYRPWKVIYVEFYNTKKEAMKREKWLKSGVGRKFIKENILKKYKGFISARGGRGFKSPLRYNKSKAFKELKAFFVNQTSFFSIVLYFICYFLGLDIISLLLV